MRSKYSIKESLNRILRALYGSPVTSDTPGEIPGDVLSENDAVSDIAELLEGSLPGKTLNTALFGAGGGWTSFVELNSDDNGITLQASDTGKIILISGMYYDTGAEEYVTQIITLPSVATGLQFLVCVTVNADLSNVTAQAVAASGEVIYGHDGQTSQIAYLTREVGHAYIQSAFIGTANGWVIWPGTSVMVSAGEISGFAFWRCDAPAPG